MQKLARALTLMLVREQIETELDDFVYGVSTDVCTEDAFAARQQALVSHKASDQQRPVMISDDDASEIDPDDIGPDNDECFVDALRQNILQEWKETRQDIAWRYDWYRLRTHQLRFELEDTLQQLRDLEECSVTHPISGPQTAQNSVATASISAATPEDGTQELSRVSHMKTNNDDRVKADLTVDDAVMLDQQVSSRSETSPTSTVGNACKSKFSIPARLRPISGHNLSQQNHPFHRIYRRKLINLRTYPPQKRSVDISHHPLFNLSDRIAPRRRIHPNEVDMALKLFTNDYPVHHTLPDTVGTDHIATTCTTATSTSTGSSKTHNRKRPVSGLTVNIPLHKQSLAATLGSRIRSRRAVSGRSAQSGGSLFLNNRRPPVISRTVPRSKPPLTPTSANKRRKTGSRSEFDIDAYVVPWNDIRSNFSIPIIKHKEIITPAWREKNELDNAASPQLSSAVSTSSPLFASPATSAPLESTVTTSTTTPTSSSSSPSASTATSLSMSSLSSASSVSVSAGSVSTPPAPANNSETDSHHLKSESGSHTDSLNCGVDRKPDDVRDLTTPLVSLPATTQSRFSPGSSARSFSLHSYDSCTALDEGSSSEDTSDELYCGMHHACELVERKRFEQPDKQKRRRREPSGAGTPTTSTPEFEKANATPTTPLSAASFFSAATAAQLADVKPEGNQFKKLTRPRHIELLTSAPPLPPSSSYANYHKTEVPKRKSKKEWETQLRIFNQQQRQLLHTQEQLEQQLQQRLQQLQQSRTRQSQADLNSFVEFADDGENGDDLFDMGADEDDDDDDDFVATVRERPRSRPRIRRRPKQAGKMQSRGSTASGGGRTPIRSFTVGTDEYHYYSSSDDMASEIGSEGAFDSVSISSSRANGLESDNDDDDDAQLTTFSLGDSASSSGLSSCEEEDQETYEFVRAIRHEQDSQIKLVVRLGNKCTLLPRSQQQLQQHSPPEMTAGQISLPTKMDIDTDAHTTSAQPPPQPAATRNPM